MGSLHELSTVFCFGLRVGVFRIIWEMNELIRALGLLFGLGIVLESLMKWCPVQQVIVFLLLGDKFDAAVVGLGNFAPDCFAFGVFCFELILLTNYRRVK